MLEYQEPSRVLPVKEQVDVLVLGAGPSGVAAAVAAARQGAKTLLVEQLGAPGGMSTSGLMSHWTGTVDSALYREILQRSADKNEGELRGKPVIEIDPEQLKLVYLELLQEAGASLRLYTFVSDVILEGTRVTGVILESKSGREAVFAKTVIDATGDGDIAYRAGVRYHKGREEDGSMQPATMMFKVGGVDCRNAVYLGSFESTYETPHGELQALARKHLQAPAGHVLLYKTTLPGIVTCNMTNCTQIDGTDADSLTQAEISCREQVGNIIAFLRRFVPGYEGCYLISTASLIGIRETRHFQGVYTLTQQDILGRRRFDDWVVRGAQFNFDVHNLTGAGLDETGVQHKFPSDCAYTIPYRCLLPLGVQGLLLCGRNISGTHMAHSNFRAMPICAAIGEAAGTAAALAESCGCALEEVSPRTIQERLG